MAAIGLIVQNFRMPGAGMPNFRRHGVTCQHFEEVLQPVMRQWNIFDRTDFGPRGEQARERLAGFAENLEKIQIPRFEEQRDRALACEAARV